MPRQQPTVYVIEEKFYIYCKDHNIYYPKELDDQAEEQKNKMLKAGMLCPIVHACPLCAIEFFAPVMTMGARIAEEHRLNREMPKVRLTQREKARKLRRRITPHDF